MQYTETPSSSHRIEEIGVISDSLTSRARLIPLVRYLAELSIFPVLESLFGRIHKNSKGQRIVEIFKQLFVFFADGTAQHLIRFDALRKDPDDARTVGSARGWRSFRRQRRRRRDGERHTGAAAGRLRRETVPDDIINCPMVESNPPAGDPCRQ